jgi:hypothetical protein
LKTVALIGDSIRIGYQPYVKQSFNGVAHIWTPVINGGNSRNILNNIQAWMDDAKADIVHINCGLHDIKLSRWMNIHPTSTVS